MVQGLVKRYGNAPAAVDNVSFTVKSGEFLTLLGPSGCGKSTTLAAVAGLERPDQGVIRFGNEVFFDSAQNRFLPAEARNCGLVFQSYALWPHLTVAQNLAFPLKLRKVAKKERQARIAEVLALVEMDPYADRYPNQLSGGQQQRVALARTLVYQPSVLLLDEPLSNLDAKLRDRARIWLSELQAKVRLTTIYVTHDQTEALSLSDRIAVMSAGKIVQIGTPHDIYLKPADPFVADFIGTSSFFKGRVRSAVLGQSQLAVEISGGQTLLAEAAGNFAVGEEVVVAVRPERIQLGASELSPGSQDGTSLPGRSISRSYLGARYQYLVDIGGEVIKTESPESFPEGELWAWIPASGCTVFKASA